MVDPHSYGWLFAVNIVGVMILSAFNRKLVHRYPLETLLKASSLVAMLAMLAMAILVKLQIGGLAAMVITIFIAFSMNGIIAASATAAALDAVPSLAGSTSALIGSLQYGSGIVSSLLLAFFSDGTPWTMTWVRALCIVASFAVVAAVKRLPG